jgi:hypothetical protein
MTREQSDALHLALKARDRDSHHLERGGGAGWVSSSEKWRQVSSF